MPADQPDKNQVEKYVCAFRGRRDSYQVPVALEESGRLEEFITDFYAYPALRGLLARLPLPAGWREKLAARNEPGLSPSRVRCLWNTTLLEHLRHRLGYSAAASYGWYDEIYSRQAAARAKRAKASLFLYSPYAWEAFAETRYPSHSPRKVLFQYHPHPDFERQVLAEDFCSHPEVRDSYVEATNEDLPLRVHRRQAECWRHADLILCASTFTRKTLLLAGAEPDRCRVVPYGVSPSDEPISAETMPADGRFRALFVGSGVQRKGLHHLLAAWGRANLPPHSELLLVCRHLDPGLEAAVARSPATVLRRHVSASELQRLYRVSSLFVMPSLIEGFGQVFLEALGEGCPVLGTTHTCLPDLGGEADGVFLVEPGGGEALIAALERMARLVPTQPSLRHAACGLAGSFDWPRFRLRINNALSEEPDCRNLSSTELS